MEFLPGYYFRIDLDAERWTAFYFWKTNGILRCQQIGSSETKTADTLIEDSPEERYVWQRVENQPSLAAIRARKSNGDKKQAKIARKQELRDMPLEALLGLARDRGIMTSQLRGENDVVQAILKVEGF
jgi:hypothetical protein